MSFISRKNILLCLALIAAALLASRIILFSQANPTPPIKNDHQVLHKLPDDVEYVLEEYKYSESSLDRRIAVSGKRVIRRGREILGLRSNLVKTNYFENIKGTFRTRNGDLVFSASAAEWSAVAAQPFILKKNVSVTVNGRELHAVRSARLYFKQGQLEVDDGQTKTFHLK